MKLFKRNKTNTRTTNDVPAYGWLRSLAWLSVSVSVISILSWGVVTMLSPQTLPLKHIRFAGQLVKTTEADLRSVINHNNVGGFFSTDVSQIKHDIQALPWIRLVEVRRVWPDTLAITVHEQQAIALWRGDTLLSIFGELFRPEVIEAQGLIKFSGPENAHQKMLTDYRTMQAMLTDSGLKIVALDMNERRAYSLTLDNGVQLSLGREDSQQRLQRFAKIYISDLAATVSAIAGIDLRYPNGFSVSWKEQKTISQITTPQLERGNHAKKS